MPRSVRRTPPAHERAPISAESVFVAIASEQARSDVLSALAHSIELAHKHGPDRWGLRLAENNIMLKVGPHEVLQAYAQDRFHIILDSGSVPNSLRESPDLSFSGRFDCYGNADAVGYYPSNPGTESCNMSAARVGSFYRTMLEAHEEAIRRAARMRRHPSTYLSHDPKAITAISRHVGRSLPQPAYLPEPRLSAGKPTKPAQNLATATHPSLSPTQTLPRTIAGVPLHQIDHVFRWSIVLSKDDYVAGFRLIESRLSDLQKQLLRHLYSAPDRAAYATQLAKWVNVRGGHSVVNLRYGAIGHLFSDATGHPPDLRTDESPRWWSILSLGHHTKYGFIWQMLPEVGAALEELGWVEPPLEPLPEEVHGTDNLLEGATCRVSVNAYERNPIARQRCIAHYGTACFVCGFDFGAKYGPVAHGFIHVHHIVPLSDIRTEYRVDPIRDLRPVCANCHAVIHLRGGCRTIEEMKELLIS